MTTYRNINKQAKKKYGYPCNNQRYKISNIKKNNKLLNQTKNIWRSQVKYTLAFLNKTNKK